MFTESIIVALITFTMALIISFSVALMIKAIFTCIRFNDTFRLKGSADKNPAWKGSAATSSK
ncbi:hypothetical protein [Desulfocucumis palustris]|uniref:hypothetical protein n=1 Tax=Desulfocucumis palustris TaxID=1898651 RepID=UPI000FFF226F|nr:hypothetical protein [Desulfocucumis palustris]